MRQYSYKCIEYTMLDNDDEHEEFLTFVCDLIHAEWVSH